VVQAAVQRHAFAQSNRDAAQARYDAQLTGINDVTRAELELATAERELTNARGAQQTAELQLEFLLNTPITQPLQTPVELEDAAGHTAFQPEALLRIAEQRRLDLASARSRADALEAWATEALLRIAPAVSANAQYRATNEAGFSGKSTTWSIGAVLSWTLFDGGAWMADRSERLSTAKAADYQALEIARKIRVDIRSAIVGLTNAQAALKQSGVALDAARKNASETSELYKQGLTSALASADANVRLFEAEVAFAGANYAVMAAYLDMRHICGLEPLGDVDPTRP
jgi:outer membrane protein TolC